MGTRMPGGGGSRREPALACVAAMVGFHAPLPVKGAGILLRSSIHAIVLEEPSRALRVLNANLACDAIVLNLADEDVNRRVDSFVELLRVQSTSGQAAAGVIIHAGNWPPPSGRRSPVSAR